MDTDIKVHHVEQESDNDIEVVLDLPGNGKNPTGNFHDTVTKHL